MKDFCILFPAFSGGLREPDPEFQREAQALDTLGVPWHVVNVQALLQGEMDVALRFFGEGVIQPVLYRARFCIQQSTLPCTRHSWTVVVVWSLRRSNTAARSSFQSSSRA